MGDTKHTITCNETLERDLKQAAKESNLSIAGYIRRSVQDSLYGESIPKSVVEQRTINLMMEIQKVKNEYPEVNVRGIEQEGGKICQWLLTR